MWSEYYIDGVKDGTQNRPWESGINAEALLKAESKSPD